MARRRCLPTNLFYNPKFEALSSDTVRLIYVGIVLDTDDYGRGLANASILGRKLAQPPETIERALPELEQQGFLECYEVKGQHCYYVCNWLKMQTLSKKTASEYPPSPSEVTSSEDLQENPSFPQNPQENFGEFRENSLEEKVKEKRRENESESKGEGERKAALRAASAGAGARELSIDEITERVAAILKLDISQALFHIVKDFYHRSDIDLITQAELAREWMDTKAKKPREMTTAFFRRWMEREVKTTITLHTNEVLSAIDAYAQSCEADIS